MRAIISRLRASLLFKTSFLNGIANLIKISISIITNKVVSVILGPSGIAMVGQFSNILVIINTFATLGISGGTTKYIAEHYDEPQKRQDCESTSFLMTIVSTLMVSIVVWVFSNYFSLSVFGQSTYRIVFQIVAVTLFMFSLNNYFLAMLNGYKQYKLIVIVNIASSILGLILTVLLTVYLHLLGAILALVLSQCVILLISFIVVKNMSWFSRNLFRHLNRTMVINLLKFAMMTFTSIFAGTYIQLLIRTYVITHVSLVDAGYWQGILRIGDMYIGLVVSTISIYYLPRISEIKTNMELKKEVWKCFIFLIPITIVCSLIMYLLRGLVISLLFSSAFMPMESLFLFYLLGNIFKVAAWLLGYILVAKAMTLLFIFTELFFGLFYYVISIFFVSNFGVIGATYAYFANYLFLFLFLLIIYRKVILRTEHDAV